jgi:mRNA-degrading endonuclease RelE of RelBE toxin-antitoxin system
MSYRLTDQCKREFKKLSQKFRTLKSDLERFCRVTLAHEALDDFPSNNKNYTILKTSGTTTIFKARMACTSLRGNKFRIVYARHEASIEIIVIEIYTKNQKDREDQKRISDYLTTCIDS